MTETIIPTLIAILGSIIATLITAIIAWLYKRKSQQEEVKILSLEAELEEQRNKLEKQQQSLIWQMEATALAMEDPRLAIITAYQGMEIELQRSLQYSTELLEELDKQKSVTLYDVNLLKDSIGPENVETVKQMRTLRNRVVHGEVNKEEVSADKAMEYVRKAIFLSRVIASS